MLVSACRPCAYFIMHDYALCISYASSLVCTFRASSVERWDVLKAKVSNMVLPPQGPGHVSGEGKGEVQQSEPIEVESDALANIKGRSLEGGAGGGGSGAGGSVAGGSKGVGSGKRRGSTLRGVPKPRARKGSVSFAKRELVFSGNYPVRGRVAHIWYTIHSSHTLALLHSLSYTLSLIYTLSPIHSLSYALSLIYTLSHVHSLSYSLSLIHSSHTLRFYTLLSYTPLRFYTPLLHSAFTLRFYTPLLHSASTARMRW
jgi:hypothetical protein